MTGSPPSAQELVGTWREVDGSGFVRFEADGAFAIDTNKLDVPYYAAGTYELERDTVSFASKGPDCASSWKWQVGLVESSGTTDELSVVFLNSWCQQLRGTELRFTRL